MKSRKTYNKYGFYITAAGIADLRKHGIVFRGWDEQTGEALLSCPTVESVNIKFNIQQDSTTNNKKQM